MPRVFLSYSHESTEHTARVTSLVRALRRDGVDAGFDRHEHRVDDWAGWMRDQVVGADVVLCVCTPTYRDRFEGRTQPGDGDGVSWEGGLVRTLLVQRKGDVRAVILKVEGRVHADVVPFELGSKTRYTLDVAALAEDAAYRQLLAHLHGRSDEVPRPVGEPPDWLIEARASAPCDLPLQAGHPDRPTDVDAATIKAIVHDLTSQLREEASLRGRLQAALSVHRAAVGLVAVVGVTAVGAWGYATWVGGQTLRVEVRCPTLHAADAPFVLWTPPAGLTGSARLAAALRHASASGARGLHLPVPWPQEPSDELRAALDEAHARQPPLVVTALQTEASPRGPLPGLRLLTLYEPQGLARFTVGGEEVDGSPLAAWPCEGVDRLPTEPFVLAGLASGQTELTCSAPWSAGWLGVGLSQPAPPKVDAGDLAGRWVILDGLGVCEKQVAIKDPCGGTTAVSRCELTARLANAAWTEGETP